MKAGLLLAGVSTIAIGIACLSLPGLLPGDRAAGALLVLCGLVFAFFALKVRTETTPPTP